MSPRLDMWSRRRAAVRAEAEAEEQAQLATVVAREQAQLEEKTDAEILAELDLPDPDDMQAGDDFSAFLKSAVPERLRRRALRKLWLSNPVLANVDNLVDYGEDFTASADALETVRTIYQVGKGMLTQTEDPPEKSAQVEPETEEETELLTETAQPEIAVIAEPTPEPETQDDAIAPPRRKMRFAFAET